MTPLRYLSFDLSEGDDGVVTLDALASTQADQRPAVLAEVRQVLAWAEQHAPGRHGPREEGGCWLHELHETDEAGGWHTVALTLSGSDEFAQALLAAFAPADE